MLCNVKWHVQRYSSSITESPHPMQVIYWAERAEQVQVKGPIRGFTIKWLHSVNGC